MVGCGFRRAAGEPAFRPAAPGNSAYLPGDGMAARPTSPLPDEQRDFLAKPNPSVIATLRPDRQPVTVATWYVLDGDRILVNMDPGRNRVEHLRQDPRVSLTVMDTDSWYRHVSIIGRVAEVADDSDLSGIDRLSTQYLGNPYGQRDRPRVNAWIEIERWHTWEGGGPMDAESQSS
jgi:PPOX class probable F420-dependent enzyme